jgi:hypothetical protein
MSYGIAPLTSISGLQTPTSIKGLQCRITLKLTARESRAVLGGENVRGGKNPWRRKSP